MYVHDEIGRLRPHLRNPVATIGNFDGLHCGHRAIVARVLERSRSIRGTSLLITFEPHPLTILAPERAPRMLATQRQKLALIESAGIDCVLNLPFTSRLAGVTAERFVDEYLHAGLSLREVYVGENFNFGRDRAGNADLLVGWCRGLGMRAEKVAEVRYLGSPISSSRIRRALVAGEVELAREMLGRPYVIEGTVVRGAGRGAGLGFPTANISTANQLVPQDGVYVTQVVVAERAHASVTNIGSRPTFNDAAFAIETHLLDHSDDLYDRPIEVRFLARLRAELKFASVEELVRQVERDVERARAFFNKGRSGA